MAENFHMPETGLPDKTIRTCHAIFVRFPAVEKVVLYGSRAMGNYRKGSDIDLTLHGAGLTYDDLSRIAGALDDSNIPYMVDLSIFENLSHAKLRDHIESKGVEFYDRATTLGWKTVKLGDVCGFKGGAQPPKSKFAYEPKEKYIRFLQIRDFKHNKNKTYIPETKKNNLCESNDILIARYGASVGQILTGKTGAYNVALMKTIPNEKLVDSKWLKAYLESDLFQSPLIEVSTRNAQNGFSKDNIKGFRLPLPPLAAQTAIVEKLDGAFAGIDKALDAARRNLDNAKALFQSYLRQSLEPRGDDWQTVKLGDVCENDKKPHKSGLALFVGLEDIEANTGKIITKLKMQEMASATTSFNEKHILFGKLRPYLNKVILPDFSGHCSSEIIPLLPKKDVAKKYIFYWITQKIITDKINDTCTGNRMPRARMAEVFDFEIPLPPLDTQTAIVARLDNIAAETQKMQTHYANKINQLEALKASILREAFAGNLTKELAA